MLFKSLAWHRQTPFRCLSGQAVNLSKAIQVACQSLLGASIVILLGCQQEPAGLAKANFDILALDEQGLDKGVAVDFEFCLANQEALIDEVINLYPDLQVMSTSPGRIGCQVTSNGQGEQEGKQVLVLGNTAVADFQQHFISLSQHPSITRIDRTYWE